jgi:hypothetical protein
MILGATSLSFRHNRNEEKCVKGLKSTFLVLTAGVLRESDKPENKINKGKDLFRISGE